MTNGQPHDIDQLVATNASDLLAYFMRRVENQADAADLLSETLVVLWRRARDAPANEHEARMWSFGIARKVLGGHWRMRRRHTAALSRVRQEIATLDSRESSDRALDVNRAIRTLAPVDQEIVRLTYWEGFTFEEIARHLKLNPSTVRSRHHRAKAALASCLQADDYLEAK